FSLKRLKAYLRDRNVGRVEIKKRGTAVVPDQLRQQLALTGPEHATIILTRLQGKQSVLVVELSCDVLRGGAAGAPCGGRMVPCRSSSNPRSVPPSGWSGSWRWWTATPATCVRLPRRYWTRSPRPMVPSIRRSVRSCC